MKVPQFPGWRVVLNIAVTMAILGRSHLWAAWPAHRQAAGAGARPGSTV